MSRKRLQRPDDCPFVGKGGLKLQFALDHFELNVEGLVAADLGCHIGGFTDCLLQNGAKKVYAVDTAYGILDWKLRNDQRVVVCERTNALHWRPPEVIDIVTLDLSWTPQTKSLEAVKQIVKQDGTILSLVKPQYEVPKEWLNRGVLSEAKQENALELVQNSIPPDFFLERQAKSPYLGGGGNIEYWLYLVRK